MSFSKTLDMLSRITKFVVCFGIAVLVVVRANQFTDPKCVSPLPAIMCCTFAVLMAFTGLALAQDRRD